MKTRVGRDAAWRTRGSIVTAELMASSAKKERGSGGGNAETVVFPPVPVGVRRSPRGVVHDVRVSLSRKRRRKSAGPKSRAMLQTMESFTTFTKADDVFQSLVLFSVGNTSCHPRPMIFSCSAAVVPPGEVRVPCTVLVLPPLLASHSRKLALANPDRCGSSLQPDHYH